MLLRAVGSALFLAAVVFTIPLAFDVGGRTCGLAFSLGLAGYYFVLSCLRLATPAGSTVRRALVRAYAGVQALVIPSLLIWCLNRFSVDEGRGGPIAASGGVGLGEWVWGRQGVAERVAIGGWDRLLRYATPGFQLAEGFCSLLVIQAAGQVTRYAVNTSDAGDGWMIGLLLVSGSVLSTAVYFLWRITTFPGLDAHDAMLLGIAIACAACLCAWGIGSGRGNVVECSLLFAYVTLAIYQVFTDYQPSHPTSAAPATPDFPPLPPVLMASYTTARHALASLPSTLHNAFGFMLAALTTVTPSVLISLTYRLLVLYAAARIIPAVRESGARALAQDASALADDADDVHTLVAWLSHFSPSILIAVYTSLLMQHFASAAADHPGEWWTSQGGEGGGNAWRWANLAGTMALYAVELYLGKGHDDGLTSHWKLD